MSIHILTQDTESKAQLKLLMGDLDQECTFHQVVATLEKVLPRLKKTDSVFYDLQLEDTLWAFERLYTGCRKTHLVAFEQLTDETGTDGHQSPMGVENYFLLSPNPSRAKTRLSAVLQELAKKSVKRKAKKKAKKTAKKRTTATTPTNATPTATIGKADSTRYLQGQSDVMQVFAAELKASAGKHKFIMLQGEDGAEFELAARELNFQANADLSPLIVLDPMHLKYEELEHIEAQAMQTKVDQYCYLGLTLELNTQSVEQISMFLGHLRMQLKDQATYLHLIIGHELESESCYPDNIRPTLEAVRETSQILNIPSMADREADISLIAHSIFSMLRMVHPFLQARSIDRSAIKHLESECASLDYSRITRVLRNAMALSQSTTLTDSEIKNFSDNSPTTQHLIESLADEKYFTSPQ
jgi:hypothetical protein